MNTERALTGSRRLRLRAPARRRAIVGVLVVVLLVLMGLGTKIVSIGSAAGAARGSFSPSAYANTQFPKVAAAVEKKAVDAATLAAALKSDQARARKKYASDVSGQPVFSVRLTGKVGAGQDGIFPVTVAGLPKGLLIRLQTGPAINGTDIRDATGAIRFSQFTNQIDYQNAGAALNDQLKKSVLGSVDRSTLPGKKVSVVGAFTLINPAGWLVTPVKVTLS